MMFQTAPAATVVDMMLDAVDHIWLRNRLAMVLLPTHRHSDTGILRTHLLPEVQHGCLVWQQSCSGFECGDDPRQVFTACSTLPGCMANGFLCLVPFQKPLWFFVWIYLEARFPFYMMFFMN